MECLLEHEPFPIAGGGKETRGDRPIKILLSQRGQGFGRATRSFPVYSRGPIYGNGYKCKLLDRLGMEGWFYRWGLSKPKGLYCPIGRKGTFTVGKSTVRNQRGLGHLCQPCSILSEKTNKYSTSPSLSAKGRTMEYSRIGRCRSTTKSNNA